MLETFFQFIGTGFAHIIPDGLDHILFVLGLFLICRDFAALLWQVSLFTVTHSVSLGLSMAGYVQLPSRPVEILIALSIAFIAIENLLRKDMSRWRSWVVGISGLVHGLGFAHAFQEHVIPRDQPWAALLGMSVGVEFGQLTVVLLACLVLGAFWNRAWYRKGIVVPGSLLLMLCGLYYAIERI